MAATRARQVDTATRVGGTYLKVSMMQGVRVLLVLNIFEKSDAKLKKSDDLEGLFISHFHLNSNSIYLKQIHKEVGDNSHNNLTNKMDSHDVYEEEINPMNNIGLKT